MSLNPKLHLIVNDQGEILSFCITPGDVDDRKPVPDLVKSLTGKLFGDRGYISRKLTDLLAHQNVTLITTLKKNMKPQAMDVFDKCLLRKRASLKRSMISSRILAILNTRSIVL